jgi:glutamate synthase (NADPH/NADH) small chain
MEKLSVLVKEENKKRPHITFLRDRCAGCQECIIRCPENALSMDSFSWVALGDDSLCVGCRQCERTCPFSAIVIEGEPYVTEPVEIKPVKLDNLRGSLSETRQGFTSWVDAISEAERCLNCPDATCIKGCPAHNDIPGFIAAIRDQDLERAHKILSSTSFMPDICSRVCDQSSQCEGACSWSLAGTRPVAIGKLERFITDNMPVKFEVEEKKIKHLRVAIIGSGPGAIGAARELVEQGAQVDCYEKASEPGGLLLTGIPDFTLPSAISKRPWEELISQGVNIICNREIKPEELDQMTREYDAVVVAVGAPISITMPAVAKLSSGVLDALDFLRGADRMLKESETEVNKELARLSVLSEKRIPNILVVGAGNTAMDVARMALRLGYKPRCIDWLDEKYSVVRPDELAEAREEGVQADFLTTLVDAQKCDAAEKGSIAVTLAKTRQVSPTSLPKVLNDQKEIFYADLIVMAMGYRTDQKLNAMISNVPIAKKFTGLASREWIGSGLVGQSVMQFGKLKHIGQLSLDREVGLLEAAIARRDKIWVVGDALIGPATVVEAMAHGRNAAISILKSYELAEQHGIVKLGNVLCAYESLTGTTKAIAEKIVELLGDEGCKVRFKHTSDVELADIAWADTVVMGTWVEGLVIAKVGPAKAFKRWLEGLTSLRGRKVLIFATYKFNPKDTLSIIEAKVKELGGQVMAKQAFGPNYKETDVRHFIEKSTEV